MLFGQHILCERRFLFWQRWHGRECLPVLPVRDRLGTTRVDGLHSSSFLLAYPLESPDSEAISLRLAALSPASTRTQKKYRRQGQNYTPKHLCRTRTTGQVDHGKRTFLAITRTKRCDDDVPWIISEDIMKEAKKTDHPDHRKSLVQASLRGRATSAMPNCSHMQDDSPFLSKSSDERQYSVSWNLSEGGDFRIERKCFSGTLRTISDVKACFVCPLLASQARARIQSSNDG